MTPHQRAYLLMQLHKTLSNQRTEVLNSEISNFGLTEIRKQKEIEEIEKCFKNGIGNLNSNQLSNLLKIAQEKDLNDTDIKTKLGFYEIAEEYNNNILEFFQDYIRSNKEIVVDKLDKNFKGVQVATRDNFNAVINQGWTGDWDLQPENIDPKRIQIASMNETGSFPRGSYINADIIDIKPIQYGSKIRYRIFISNPVIINTGNRNVKFNNNPVRYIR
jgi:hypothetical protein